MWGGGEVMGVEVRVEGRRWGGGKQEGGTLVGEGCGGGEVEGRLVGIWRGGGGG